MVLGHERPLGSIVQPGHATRPEPGTLTGGFVRLVPLAAAHADDLFPIAGGAENAWLWDYMPDGPFPDLAGFREHIARKAASADPLFFAILDKGSGKAIGHTTLMRIDTANRAIETGNILFSPLLQRTPGATESMYLLARHAFDDLGYRRYEWKCNALNMPSRRAAERFGFTFEGVFRQHMIVKGRNRDTAWYSMLDTEWPAVKNGFEAWLAPGNFDAEGRQKASLASFRNPK
ncbi:GNAT family N-acetyltransferase [Lichenifustis flavocetrariae]|uniref:GNAT family N-acetyltransferase n=1 Tax=Lichenifustis flavocetrariae TaxID=2949735 RepID=A0AA42CLC3_9HYPH|nr:GNAT family protein [Lichenifustis flavocetrariae]MCW6507160.1 GNAT family N-acetyltransferase [Lichenifustis flavocetrariae]